MVLLFLHGRSRVRSGHDKAAVKVGRDSPEYFKSGARAIQSFSYGWKM